MEPTKQNLDSLSADQVAAFIQKEEDELPISLISLFESPDASSTAYPTVYTEEEETIYLPLPITERDANLKKVHEQLLAHDKGNLKPLPVAEAYKPIKVFAENITKVHEQLLVTGKGNLKPVTTHTPKTLSKETRNQFQKILHLLTSDAPALKTPVIATKETPINEEWVGKYQDWVNKYQDTVNELNKPAEQQIKIQFKKLASSKANTIMLLSESVMITSVPSKKGLADLPYKYQYWNTQPYEIIEYLFTNAEKIDTEKRHYKFTVDIETDDSKPAQYLFDLTNETYLELLEQTFSYYIEQQDTDKIIALLDKCQCTAGELQLSPRIAGKLHDYLENLTRQEEQKAKVILENKADEFVTKSNARIIALQEEFTKRAEELQQEFDNYQKDYNNTLEQKAASMRHLKENTIATHILCSDLKLGKTKCSDSIDCLRSKETKAKVYLTQEDVSTVYSNGRLLNKMELSKPMATLQQNTQDLLRHINAINKATHNVKLLT